MKKKPIVIAIVAVVVLCVGGFLIKTQMDSQSSKDQEKLVESITKTYYEEFFYDAMTVGKDEAAKTEFFSPYEKDGFKTSIESIGNVSEIDISKDLKKLGSSCNQKKNNITITPKAPYGKTDYKVKVVCD